jgi:4-amino-4-deoxy-L-arabinose transferase-like glycosyltransferase
MSWDLKPMCSSTAAEESLGIMKKMAAVASAGFFVFLTLPRLPFGAVVGTGQDEWYNVVRGLRALYERLNPSYFIHPALYYELLAGVFGARRVALVASGGSGAIEFADRFLTHQAEFLDMARYLSLASGALAVAAAVWLGTVLSGVSAGVLAGLVVASLPVLQELATSIRVDALGLATLLGAAALVVRWHDRPNRHSLFVAAAGIGVAAAANYPGALLLLLLPWSEWARSGLTNLAPRALGLLKAAGLALAVFLLLNPYVILDPRLFLRWFFFQAQVPLLRHPHAEEPNAARYLILLAQQGRPALVASGLAVAGLSMPRRATAALAAFALAYLAGFSLMQSQYDRFALPAIGLLGVAGAAWLCALLARVRPWLAPLAAVLLVPLIVWSALRAPRAAFGEPGQDYRAQLPVGKR